MTSRNTTMTIPLKTKCELMTDVESGGSVLHRGSAPNMVSFRCDLSAWHF